MSQLNPFAQGEQKRRARLNVAALETDHATFPTVADATIVTIRRRSQYGPPSCHHGRPPWHVMATPLTTLA
jgi:hypothetical protein